jgi:hypothetical protein
MSQLSHATPFTFFPVHNDTASQSFEHFDLHTPPLITSKQPPTNNIVKLTRPTTVRNYEAYSGRTLFFCNGRLLTSRAFWAFGLSLFLIIVPSILFLIFT